VVDTTTWSETMIGDDFGNVRGIDPCPTLDEIRNR
jgi:hypothetical protein